jgi:hypothetical protein
LHMRERRASGFKCRALLAGALATCVVAMGGGSAHAAQITGISDQNMAPAPGIHGGWDSAANNIYALLNLPQARYITSWDVASHNIDPSSPACDTPCRRYHELKNWVAKAQAQGKQALISFGDQVCPSDPNSFCPPPTADAYGWGINLFLNDPAFANVREFTAWNEPNHPVPKRGSPQRVASNLAATYWKVLNDRCQARFANSCKVAAGDLSDTDEYLSYTNSYKSTLSSLGANPPVWAIHPYAAVDSNQFNGQGPVSVLFSWINGYTNGKPIWFSEVGALNCSPNRGSLGLSYQNDRASFLKNQLLPSMPARVERTYYYFLAKPGGQQESCPGFDSALVGAGDSERPALHTLFPSLRSTQESAAAAALSSRPAERSAAAGYQWLYFVGVDHQIWEWSWNGTSWANSQLGGEQAAANTSPTFVRDAVSGQQWVYYVGADGQIWAWSWNGSSWGNARFAGEPAAANTSPTVTRDPVTGYQWVYYVGVDGQVWAWSWNGSSWGNAQLAGQPAAANTSPTTMNDPTSRQQWVYYVGADHQVWAWSWNGSSWGNARFAGEQAVLNSSLTALRDPLGGQQWLYYVGDDGQIWTWSWNGSSWGNARLAGAEAAGNTTPTGVRDPATGYQWLYYTGTDGQIRSWSWSGSWSNSVVGGQAAANVSPTVLRDAPTGYQWIYYIGADHQTSTWSWNTSSWTSGQLIGESAADTVFPPPPPSGVTAMSSAGGTVTIYWSPSTGATSYRLYKQTLQRDGTWSPASPGQLLYTASGTAYLELAQQRTRTFRYRVIASNAAGDSPLSSDTSKSGAVIPPFNYYTSPWNQVANTVQMLTSTQLDTITPNDSNASGSVILSGTPEVSPNCGIPVYQAELGDPVASVSGLVAGSQPDDTWRYDGNGVPVPPGTTPEDCSNRHLSIINRQRTGSYDFWKASSVSNSNITAYVVAQITGLDSGTGYSATPENSAQASGVPLVDTAIRPEEFYYGIRHAIGLTVPDDIDGCDVPLVAGDCPSGHSVYEVPASHTDGGNRPGELHYGQRLVLRSDFPEAGSVGRVNLIRALKTFGGFITNRDGFDLEVDAASPNDPGGFYSLAGVQHNTLSCSTCGYQRPVFSDFRLVTSTKSP